MSNRVYLRFLELKVLEELYTNVDSGEIQISELLLSWDDSEL